MAIKLGMAVHLCITYADSRFDDRGLDTRSQSDRQKKILISAMAFKLRMTVDLCMAYIIMLMLVSMTLTLSLILKTVVRLVPLVYS